MFHLLSLRIASLWGSEASNRNSTFWYRERRRWIVTSNRKKEWRGMRRLCHDEFCDIFIIYATVGETIVRDKPEQVDIKAKHEAWWNPCWVTRLGHYKFVRKDSKDSFFLLSVKLKLILLISQLVHLLSLEKKLRMFLENKKKRVYRIWIMIGSRINIVKSLEIMNWRTIKCYYWMKLRSRSRRIKLRDNIHDCCACTPDDDFDIAYIPRDAWPIPCFKSDLLLAIIHEIELKKVEIK